MIGDNDEPGDSKPVDEDVLEDVSEDDVAEDDISDKEIDLTADDMIDGASTAEIKVDALVAKIDSEDAEEIARQREIRRKLDALEKGGDDEFGSTYNFNIDEDL